MAGIRYLRSIVEMGFTNGNLKQLKSSVGNQEFQRLTMLWKDLTKGKGNELCNDIYIRPAETRIAKFGGKIELKINAEIDGYEACPYNPKKLLEEDISIENIKKALQEFREKVLGFYGKKLPESSLESSNTLKTLFKPEFKPKRHINEDGYFVTTIIDKKTGKPVEAYVKSITKTNDSEKWGIFVKRGSEYEQVGCREFGIDNKSKKITSMWMDGQGHDEYAGIGIRAHQIGVERMLQNGFIDMEIEAASQAFPFHYKTGFRIIRELQDYTSEYKDLIDYCSKETGFSPKKVEEILNFIKKDGKIYLDTLNVEKLRKLSYLENNGKIMHGLTPMHLKGEQLLEWIERVKSQPIIM